MDFAEEGENFTEFLVILLINWVVLFLLGFFAAVVVFLIVVPFALLRQGWPAPRLTFQLGLLDQARSLNYLISFTTPPCFCLICVNMAALLR